VTKFFNNPWEWIVQIFVKVSVHGQKAVQKFVSIYQVFWFVQVHVVFDQLIDHVGDFFSVGV